MDRASEPAPYLAAGTERARSARPGLGAHRRCRPLRVVHLRRGGPVATLAEPTRVAVGARPSSPSHGHLRQGTGAPEARTYTGASAADRARAPARSHSELARRRSTTKVAWRPRPSLLERPARSLAFERASVAELPFSQDVRLRSGLFPRRCASTPRRYRRDRRPRAPPWLHRSTPPPAHRPVHRRWQR